MKPNPDQICLVVKALKTWPAALLFTAATGCDFHAYYHHSSTFSSSVTVTSGFPWPKEHQMQFRYTSRDGNAALESDRVVLVFHGLTAQQQQLFHFGGDQQGVQVAGDGSSTVSVTCSTEAGKVAFESAYANGTNTLRFDQQTIRLVQGGRLLLAGARAVDLSGSPRVVHLRDGRVVGE